MSETYIISVDDFGIVAEVPVVYICGERHILAPDYREVMTFWRIDANDRLCPIEDEDSCDHVVWSMILSRFAPEV